MDVRGVASRGFRRGNYSLRGSLNREHLGDMNGLYSREQQLPSGFSHKFTFSYRALVLGVRRFTSRIIG